MSTVAAVLSAFFTAIIALLNFRTMREMRLATDESGRAAINILVVRGRRTKTTRQNIFLMFRNDGKFPAYDLEFAFSTPWGEPQKHRIEILDPGCYDIFMFGPGVEHREAANHLRKLTVDARYATHAGTRVSKSIKPVIMGVDSNATSSELDRSYILAPNPILLNIDLDGNFDEHVSTS